MLCMRGWGFRACVSSSSLSRSAHVFHSPLPTSHPSTVGRSGQEFVEAPSPLELF